MEQVFYFILVGIGCGVLSAMFGVGSGIIMIPALVLLFHFPQKSAQGICLAAMVPMALVGAIQYKLDPDIPVDMAAVAWLSVGAVAGALIGAQIAGALSGMLLRRLFAVIMIVVAVRMLATGPERTAPGAAPGTVATQQDRG